MTYILYKYWLQERVTEKTNVDRGEAEVDIDFRGVTISHVTPFVQSIIRIFYWMLIKCIVYIVFDFKQSRSSEYLSLYFVLRKFKRLHNGFLYIKQPWYRSKFEKNYKNWKWNSHKKSYGLDRLTAMKLEAHGPHCSPEKQFELINTFAQNEFKLTNCSF